MILTRETYQKIISTLEEMQLICSDGFLGKNVRDCLMEISTDIYKIRKEFADNLLLEEDD